MRAVASTAVVLALLTLAPRAQTPAPTVPWTRIPSGIFEMGCVPDDPRCDLDEAPRHAVRLTRAFDLMTTEVTVEEFRAATPMMPEQPPWSTTPQHPVTIVRWDEARMFCEAVGGRLPTEAEWEYAARGGKDGLIFPWGSQPPTDRAGAATGAAFESDGAKPTKTFAANGYGLHDMAGNVWEWVADWYAPYGLDPVTDPTGPAMGTTRVVRGGSYGDDDANLRVSNRSANAPRNRNFNIGFRCAKDVTGRAAPGRGVNAALFLERPALE